MVYKILDECSKGYKLRTRVGLYSNFIYEDVRFVDRANGSDGNDGSDWDHPKKTINDAVDEFYSGSRDNSRGRHFAIIFRSRLTGGNAFTATEGQQKIDIPGVHLIGAGSLYGDGGGWTSCFVTNSTYMSSDAHISGCGAGRVGLLVEGDDVLVQGIKFYCSDETNMMWHVALHDYDQTNDSSNAGRNNQVINCHFQGDVDGTAEINGVAMDGAEASSVLGCRFQYTHIGVKFAGGGARYANEDIIQNNIVISNKYGIQGGNASTRENVIADNYVVAKGQYGWAITYGIDGGNSSTDSLYVNNIVGHATEATAFNYGSGNFWINNYHCGSGGTLGNPDA